MKKLISLLLALAMLTTAIPAVVAAGFTDVDSGAWYAEAVDYVVDNKLMSGYSASEFAPNDALSRAMVVQVLYNREGQPAQSGSHGFNDVKTSDWFNNAVTWGTKRGVMSGYGEGKFAPNDNVTIEQIAVILWNYAGKPAFSASADSVGTHSSWAANGLGWAVENGILDKVPYDAVTEGATRAQTAQMLANFFSGKAAPVVVTGITLDITSHKMGEDWTQYLTATLSPAGAKDTITWTSSNPKVATVNEKGKVSGVAGGETIITATTSNGLTATCKVEVWHSHKLTAVRESSCLTAGFERYTCSGCGHSYEKYLPAVGGEHRWFTDYCTRCGISPCDYSQVTLFTDTGYAEYDRLIAEYAFAAALGCDNDFEYNSYWGTIDAFAKTCEKAYAGAHIDAYTVELMLWGGLSYALYDINADGTPELLISEANPSWGSGLIVHGLDANGKATFLGSGIGRGRLHVLSDGRLLHEGSSGYCNASYELYRVIENGKIQFIEAYYWDSEGPDHCSDIFDEPYLNWKEYDRRLTSFEADSIIEKLTWIPLS